MEVNHHENIYKLDTKSITLGEFLIIFGSNEINDFIKINLILITSIDIFYMRAGNKGRLFFRYSKEEKGMIEKLGESNKDSEQAVINNLRQNYP